MCKNCSLKGIRKWRKFLFSFLSRTQFSDSTGVNCFLNLDALIITKLNCFRFLLKVLILN